MKRFAAALRFLTILPVPEAWCGDAATLSGTPAMFPLVGLLLGVAAGAAAWGLVRLVPGPVASVLLVTGLVGASGGMHLDGLSDMADGFFSSRSRQRILEIMKDSRIGAMGVIAIVLTLAMKIVCFANLPAPTFWRVAALTPIAGRCGMLLVLSLLPYARPEGGLGKPFAERRTALQAGWAVLVLAAAAYGLLQMEGLAITGVSLAAALLLAAWSFHKIGGATGDVYGAACELTELMPVFTMITWLGIHTRGAL